jgi:F-type H+-transporting ATPase subunit epsilon
MYMLSIVTPEKVFYEGEVSSLIIPGTEGYLGVLTDHAPLITATVPGKVMCRQTNGDELTMAASFGFFEVSSNHATLLVDSVEFASDIDLDRAREALKRAEQRMANEAGEIDLPRARRAVERARNRLKVAEDEQG